MQQIMLEHNKHAVFIPCSAHSLNLVGRSAVDCCTKAVDFFSTVQELYKFFVASTHRWKVLTHHLAENCVLKTLSDTRWEAHAAATHAISDSYSRIIDALNALSHDQSQKGDTKREAKNHTKKMKQLEFALMLVVWDEILQAFHRTSQRLQAKIANLSVCANLYVSLKTFLTQLRNEFDRLETTAKERVLDTEYKEFNARKCTRKKQHNDGPAPELELNPRDKFRMQTFYVIIDTLQSEIQRRGSVYKKLGEI